MTSGTGAPERPFTADDARLIITALGLASIQLKIDAHEIGEEAPEFETHVALAAKMGRLRTKVERWELTR